jgi:hypothetical protein
MGLSTVSQHSVSDLVNIIKRVVFVTGWIDGWKETGMNGLVQGGIVKGMDGWGS